MEILVDFGYEDDIVTPDEEAGGISFSFGRVPALLALLLLSCTTGMAQISPPPGTVPCTVSHTTNCSVQEDGSGNVSLPGNLSIGTTVPGGFAPMLKGSGAGLVSIPSPQVYLWAGATQPSCSSADAPNNTCGPGGTTVAGETLTYAQLITLWDYFPNTAFPDVTVTKANIGSDQSGTYTMYSYTFTPNGPWDRTVIVAALLKGGEVGSSLAAMRAFYSWAGYAGTDRSLWVPKTTRYIVFPCGDPWGFDNGRSEFNSRNVDLNRNWTWGWAASSDAHKGASALSEQETKNINTVINASGATALVDIHDQGSTGSAVWMAYLPFNTIPQDYSSTLRVINFLNGTATGNTATVYNSQADALLMSNAASLGMTATDLDKELSSGEGHFLSSQWMTDYTAYVADIILSLSQTDPVVKQSPVPSPRTVTTSLLHVSNDPDPLSQAPSTSGAYDVNFNGNDNSHKTYIPSGQSWYDMWAQYISGYKGVFELRYSGAASSPGKTLCLNTTASPAAITGSALSTAAFCVAQNGVVSMPSTTLESWSPAPYVAGTASWTLTTGDPSYYSFNLPQGITLNGIGYRVATLDNSANLYDIGVYSLSGTLLAHTGPTAGTTFSPSTGFKTLAFLSPGTVYLPPGTYLFAITGNANTMVLNAVENVMSYTRIANPGTATSISGTLDASISPASKSPNASTGLPWFQLY